MNYESKNLIETLQQCNPEATVEIEVNFGVPSQQLQCSLFLPAIAVTSDDDVVMIEGAPALELTIQKEKDSPLSVHRGN